LQLEINIKALFSLQFDFEAIQNVMLAQERHYFFVLVLLLHIAFFSPLGECGKKKKKILKRASENKEEKQLKMFYG
jgi:hypothetical protein